MQAVVKGDCMRPDFVEMHRPATVAPMDELEYWVGVIRAEYLEMPGLRLTRAQAQRLWGLDRATCDAVLESLQRCGFLRRSVKDLFMRADLEV